MNSNDLIALKDDMVAFVEGHGMRHFPALIPEDTPRVWWNDPASASSSGDMQENSRESWKDFVEMAKTAGAPMVCIGEDVLDKAALELLASEFQAMSSAESLSTEMEKLDRLFLEVGKVGHIELAFAHQGILFVHESATEWYRHYREMVNIVEDLQELIGKAYEDDSDEERE